MATSYGLSQAQWYRYAAAADLAGCAAGDYSLYGDEPPLSPDEEEALMLGGASFGGQDALF